ncbi:MAG TPA: hypothetical protein VJ860_17800 [Polyangia bacterium]|jgi:hypothetical protein|nr:hypothetical protein [Polyangia bacterium]
MRNLGILVTVSLVAFALGCGSGGGTGTTPTGGSSGGTGTTPTGGSNGGASGTTPTGGGNGSATCSLPSCLKYLATDCVESGTCSTLTDLSTGSYNTCYANGIKEIVVHDVSTDLRTMTVKKGSSTCFSTEFDGNAVMSGYGGSITVRDASGATVATVKYDDTVTYYLVTCTGAQEVAIDVSCKTAYPTSILMTSKCEEGGCTP